MYNSYITLEFFELKDSCSLYICLLHFVLLLCTTLTNFYLVTTLNDCNVNIKYPFYREIGTTVSSLQE